MVDECFYMPRAGEFYPEEPPELKEQIVSQVWNDMPELGPLGYTEERGLVPFPDEDFEGIAGTFLYRKDEGVSVDYVVYRRRADGTLYLLRHRECGEDVRETILQVDGWQPILDTIAQDGGYFEPEMDWALAGHPPGWPGFEDHVVVSREELVDGMVDMLREGP